MPLALVHTVLVDDPQELDEVSSEPVYLTTKEVAENFGITIGTVARWHTKEGLPARKSNKKGGSREFLLADIIRFASDHDLETRKQQGQKVTTESYRTETIERLYTLLTDDKSLSLSEAMRMIASERDLSISALEKWLRTYREQDSDDKLEIRSSSITQETKDDIYRDFCEGTDYTLLASRYSLTRQSIIDLLYKQRALRLSDKEIAYVHNPDFDKKNAYKNIIVGRKKPKSTWKQMEKPPEGMPPYLGVLYSIPQLNKPEEQYYFNRMNYYYHRALEYRNGVVQTPTGKNKTAYYIEQAEKLKRMLVRCNLRLVVSVSKKFKSKNSASFEELYGDGCLGLMEAVNRFDFSKDLKFSTYATYCIRSAVLDGIRSRKKANAHETTVKEDMWDRVRDDSPSLERQQIDHEKQAGIAAKI
ncbi:MAG: sigma-70 family RNA polymerase sigma factor [bacterium]|nr:sigma-70 family RNA polymerase sigma factor [bacterium]